MARNAIVFLALWGIACCVGAAEVKKFAGDDDYMVGVNLAGAEFAPHAIPGVENRNYGWPGAECLDYWKNRGIRLIRLPFLWQRLQPTLMGGFDPTYVAGFDRTMRLLEERKMSVILDLHNYQMRMGKAIGGVDVPLAAYADLMRRLAARYRDSPSLWGYGLMNEPNGKGCPWAKCAQAGIDAIRTVDRRTQILVANDYPGWQCTQIAKTVRSDEDVL
ncbi:MAG: cellulase family glycosylhydrolase, partial [Lentisphaerae bacterium]|nr:cellulase family glycosylhydrolase [Lentisphaerota bacterium]